MSDTASVYGGEVGRLLWRAISVTSAVTGISVGAVIGILGLVLTKVGAHPAVSMTLMSSVSSLLLIRIALNSAHGTAHGGLWTGTGSSWNECLVALARVFVLNLSWSIPMSLILKVSDQVGPGLLMGAGPSPMTMLLTLVSSVLAPLCLISGIAAPSFGELFTKEHWLELFVGRGSDLVVLIATFIGGMTVSAGFGFMAASVLNGGKVPLMFMFFSLAGAYGAGVCFLLMGRLIGGFIRTGNTPAHDAAQPFEPEPFDPERPRGRDRGPARRRSPSTAQRRPAAAPAEQTPMGGAQRAGVQPADTLPDGAQSDGAQPAGVQPDGAQPGAAEPRVDTTPPDRGFEPDPVGHALDALLNSDPSAGGSQSVSADAHPAGAGLASEPDASSPDPESPSGAIQLDDRTDENDVHSFDPRSDAVDPAMGDEPLYPDPIDNKPPREVPTVPRDVPLAHPERNAAARTTLTNEAATASVVEFLNANSRWAEAEPETALEQANEFLAARGPHPQVLCRIAALEARLGEEGAADTARDAVNLARGSGSLAPVAELLEPFRGRWDELGLEEGDWVKLAGTQKSLSRYDAALELYQRVLAENPNCLPAIKGMMQIADTCLEKADEPARAIGIFDYLDTQCPDHPFGDFVERGRELAERKLTPSR